jgi:FkbM family methyltransferase
MSLGSKISWFFQYLRFFSDIGSVRAFSALRKGRMAPGTEVALKVRRLPGASLLCRSGTSDAEVLWDVFWGQYHLPETALPAAPVIFDLGANVGYSCFDFGTLFPGARIIGVELDEDNVVLARRNTAVLGDACQIVHGAIWRDDGEVSYSKQNEEWGYQVSRGAEEMAEGAEVRVRALSIDTLMRETGVTWVDYMKIDIEGAEDDVLEPDAAWLQRTGMVSLEVHAPATIEKCTAVLEQAGFACRPSSRHRNGLIAVREDQKPESVIR